MKYRMNFGWWKTLILGIVIAACIAVLVIDVLLLVGTDTMKTDNPAIAGVSIAAAVIILAVAVLLCLNSFYRFDEDKLVCVLGMFVDKIPYDQIESAAVNKKTAQVVIVVAGEDGKGSEAITLNLSPARGKAFLDALQDKCGIEINELDGKKGVE